MKPFKAKRYKKRLITYKRLFIAIVILFAGYAWYSSCDKVCSTVNNNVKIEEK